MALICPRCMAEAVITLDLDDCETLRCPACEETYTVADVTALVASWAKILPWLNQCPARQQQPAAT